jgi:non-ribosomal peptide synthetase-like protein
VNQVDRCVDFECIPLETTHEPSFVHEIFRQQVHLRPTHAAIEFAEYSMDYRSLEEESNDFARRLNDQGLGRGDFVALYFSKALELYVSLLAVLKIGAIYIPIDPKFPAERITAIVEDANASCLLTSHTLAANLSGRAAEIALTAQYRPEARRWKRLAILPHLASLKQDDLCYAIYTSGSTGKPKGVAIEHRNLAAYVRCLRPVYGIQPDDRVYQGFSLAFDAALEELWMAWSAGATLVVPAEDVARSPADAAQFIKERRVSVLSTVPSFLSMIGEALPDVRLLITGGEACPPELVNRWAPGRRMLNTYGPTETTVVATWSELKAGEPVTIGRALPGYYTRVLREDGWPVRPGEAGELYIGGNGVARGYLNRPDLTEERFVRDPSARREGLPGTGRLYRTADHVRLLPSGDLEFLGRLDGQVKIRGFRVELAEIEAVMLNHPSVSAAAVNAAGEGENRQIAAYAVPAPGASIDREGIAVLLRERLPEYMIPKYLDTVKELPLMTSGKVDRKALPAPETLLAAGGECFVAPATCLERRAAAVWEEVLGVSPVSAEANFFEIGGHSLLAARTVSILRTSLGAAGLAVRDMYSYPTIKTLARRLEELNAVTSDYGGTPGETGQGERRAAAFLLPAWKRVPIAFLQLLSVYMFYSVVTIPLLYVLLKIKELLTGAGIAQEAIIAISVTGLLTWPALFILSIAMKWLIIGQYKPGRYPLWGFYYFRWWLATRFQSLAGAGMFAGTPLMSVYYRLMGAKIGKHCTISTSLCSIFDTLSVGGETSIGAETQILGYRVENGMLHIGEAAIGERCFIGMHCAIGLNVKMADDAKLDDMSLLNDGEEISAGASWRGAPAAPAASLDVAEPSAPLKHRPFLFSLLHLTLLNCMGYVLLLTMLPASAIIGAAWYFNGWPYALAAAYLCMPLNLFWYIFCVAAVKRIFIGRLKPETCRIESAAYLRHWFLTGLLNITRNVLMPLYATCYLPSFLRLMGGRIGKHAEISTVLQITPDLVEIGDGSFCADASLIGGSRVHRGLMSLKTTRIGKRSFVGNSAFAPAGADIGDDCLIGVLSTPPAGLNEQVNGKRWLGSPGFCLPSTQHDMAFDERTTYSPSRKLRLLRGMIDAVRVFLPGVIKLSGAAVFLIWLGFSSLAMPLWAVAALTPLVLLGLSLASVAAAALVKKLLIGTYKPSVNPLYSTFVWRNEVVNAVYEGVAAPAMSVFLGTPFIGPVLRLMGCKIGRWVFLETTLFSEFDLVEIGDHAALNTGVTIQTHLFEDRIMKADVLRIGSRCSLGNMAVVLYDTQMQEGAWLGPLSVLMKGETLPSWSRSLGIPSQPAGSAAQAPAP